MVGIKSKIIHCGEANRISVLIRCKRFGAPCDRACVLSNIPRRAAIPSISLGAIVCPAGMLKRRMKPDVRDICSGYNRHAERLNTAIQVLVVERVFVVPHASSWIRDFVPHEPNAIVAWVGLELAYRRASPSVNGWVLSHGRA